MMMPAETPTSDIVVASCSVTADRSEALSLEFCTLCCTPVTTFSMSCVLSMIIFRISCSLSMKVLMPRLKSAISSLERMVIRLVRSPCPRSSPSMMALISFLARAIGLTTRRSTTVSAMISARMLMIMIVPLISTAL